MRAVWEFSSSPESFTMVKRERLGTVRGKDEHGIAHPGGASSCLPFSTDNGKCATERGMDVCSLSNLVIFDRTLIVVMLHCGTL